MEKQIPHRRPRRRGRVRDDNVLFPHRKLPLTEKPVARSKHEAREQVGDPLALRSSCGALQKCLLRNEKRCGPERCARTTKHEDQNGADCRKIKLAGPPQLSISRHRKAPGKNHNQQRRGKAAGKPIERCEPKPETDARRRSLRLRSQKHKCIPRDVGHGRGGCAHCVSDCRRSPARRIRHILTGRLPCLVLCRRYHPESPASQQFVRYLSQSQVESFHPSRL